MRRCNIRWVKMSVRGLRNEKKNERRKERKRKKERKKERK